ncbi:hypothetical protein GCM10009836_68560 [Pseudonocardia ailaonensis]|uniref:Uncharacterized protein n=1 Tax=Pseudonocardia ailaonensis TaxID=367279 RepID=A0ABN2NRG1_9PSEU
MGYRLVSEAAFGSRPGVSVHGDGRTDPAVRWTAAVALGGQGRFAAAAALLEGLLRDPRTPPEIRAHAFVARASHLRQRGGHAAAERLDGAAAALATAVLRGRDRPGGPAGETVAATPALLPPTGPDGTPRGLSGVAEADALSALADALVGLAADALGQGSFPRATALLARAEALAITGARRPLTSDDEVIRRPLSGSDGRAGAVPGCRRSLVRLGWVRAELALAQGDLRAARRAAAQALVGADALGSLRHRIKSALLVGVVDAVAAAQASAAGAPATGAGARRDPGDQDVAAEAPHPTLAAALGTLDAVARDAVAAGLLPLAWAALKAAADLTPVTPASPLEVIDTAGVGRPPSGGSGRPSDRPNGSVHPHDRRPEWLLRSTNGAPNDAARRRHAADVTLSVIRARSEGVGRRLMGGVVHG